MNPVIPFREEIKETARLSGLLRVGQATSLLVLQNKDERRHVYKYVMRRGMKSDI